MIILRAGIHTILSVIICQGLRYYSLDFLENIIFHNGENAGGLGYTYCEASLLEST